MTLTELPDVETSTSTHDGTAKKIKDGKIKEGKKSGASASSMKMSGWTEAEDEELTTNFNE